MKHKTPFAIYTDHQRLLGKEMDYFKGRRAYSDLSADEKRVWIQRAIEAAPDVNFIDIILLRCNR